MWILQLESSLKTIFLFFRANVSLSALKLTDCLFKCLILLRFCLPQSSFKCPRLPQLRHIPLNSAALLCCPVNAAGVPFTNSCSPVPLALTLCLTRINFNSFFAIFSKAVTSPVMYGKSYDSKVAFGIAATSRSQLPHQSANFQEMVSHSGSNLHA